MDDKEVLSALKVGIKFAILRCDTYSFMTSVSIRRFGDVILTALKIPAVSRSKCSMRLTGVGDICVWDGSWLRCEGLFLIEDEGVVGGDSDLWWMASSCRGREGSLVGLSA